MEQPATPVKPPEQLAPAGYFWRSTRGQTRRRVLIRKRRSAKGMAPVSRRDIEEVIKRATELRDQAFIALLYLTSRRVGEIVLVRPEDIKTGEYTGKKVVWVHHLIEKKGTKKHPKPPQYGDTPIPADDPLLDYVWRWIKLREEHCHGRFDRWLFGFGSGARAWQILTKLDPAIWVHWFRHMGLTHAAVTMNPYELREYAHFETLEPAVNYVHAGNMLSKLFESNRLHRRMDDGPSKTQAPDS